MKEQIKKAINIKLAELRLGVMMTDSFEKRDKLQAEILEDLTSFISKLTQEKNGHLSDNKI